MNTPRALRRLLGRFHWLLIPVLLFAATQLIYAGALHMQAGTEVELPATMTVFETISIRHKALTADSPHSEFAQSWDGQWYRLVAEHGYPAELPRSDDGEVLPNQWAFYPLYPTIVGGVMAVTGLSFGLAGVLVSMAFALAGFALLYGWVVRHTRSRWTGTLAILSVMLTPASFIFQATYTESLTLLLVVSFLYLLSSRRYLTAVPVVLLLGLTRNIVVPLVLVGLVVGIAQVWAYMKANDSTLLEALQDRKTAVCRYLALGFATCVSALIWPVTVALALGEPTAYVQTYSAWFGHNSTVLKWFTSTPLSPSDAPWSLTLGFVIVVLVAAIYLAVNRHSTYPLALKLYPLMLAIYIFIATGPSGSILRYLTLGFFLFPWTNVPRTQAGRVAYFGGLGLLAVASIALSYMWIGQNWIVADGRFQLIP